MVAVAILVIFAGCSQVDDTQNNPMASMSQDSVTTVEGKDRVAGPTAASIGASMTTAWPFVGDNPQQLDWLDWYENKWCLGILLW